MASWIAEVGSQVRQHLRELEARGSPAFAAQVADAFLRDAATRLAALRDAIAARDANTAFTMAHGIQGSAAMIGAARLADACGDVAAAARGGDFARCEELLPDVAAGLSAIERAITSGDRGDHTE